MSNGYHAIDVIEAWHHAQEADQLCEYVMPLNIQKIMPFNYDAMHAGQSSTAKKFAEWTFFQILQVSGTRSIYEYIAV